jgi:hypothetical protein
VKPELEATMMRRALIGGLAGAAVSAALVLGQLFAIAPANAAVSPAASRPVHSTFVGLHPTYETPTVFAGSWRLWDSGTQWADLNPAPGTYNWKPLDAMVAKGRAQGVRDFLVVLGITPSWAASNPEVALAWAPHSSPSPPTDMAYFDAYVRALAVHNRDVLGGAINSLQVWNEANLPLFWSGTPQQMADMTARADRILAEVDATYPASTQRNSTLVAPSVSLRRNVLPTWSPLCVSGTRPDACWLSAYLDALEDVRGAAGRAWPVDAYSFHSYPLRDGGPDDRVALINLAKMRIADSGSPRKPLWDTEVNYGIRGLAITGAKAAQYISRTYVDSLRLGLARVYWYAWGNLPEGLLGITMVDNSVAARSFSSMSTWLLGATYRGCTERVNLTSCSFTRTSRGRVVPFRIMWSESGVRHVSVRASARVSRLAPTGASISMRSSTSVAVDSVPVMIA